MRKNLAGIGVLICFAFMLLFPKDVFNGGHHLASQCQCPGLHPVRRPVHPVSVHPHRQPDGREGGVQF